MNKDQYYQSWKEKNFKKIEELLNAIPEADDNFILSFIKSVYTSGYYDGVETQETKTSQYNWDKWNQK